MGPVTGTVPKTENQIVTLLPFSDLTKFDPLLLFYTHGLYTVPGSFFINVETDPLLTPTLPFPSLKSQ